MNKEEIPMKRTTILLFASTLALAGCAAAGISLTTDNASNYLSLSSTGSTQCSSVVKVDDTTFTITFDIYPTHYGLNNDISGTCSFDFVAISSTYDSESKSFPHAPKVAETAPFVFRDGGSDEAGNKQMDSLRATFTYKDAPFSTVNGTSTISNLVFLTITGTVQG